MPFGVPYSRFGMDPFAEIRRLQSEINQLFDVAGAMPSTASYPPMNLWLGDNSVVVTAEVPGLSGDDIDVTVEDDTLTIRGNRTDRQGAEGAVWYRRERPTGAFARTVQLPFRVDPDRVQARVVNGVLAVEMQRPQQDLPRRIEIKSN